MLCSKDFDEDPHWSVIRELLSQTFGVPNKHPKSQPFFDRVYTFAVADDRIWFRQDALAEGQTCASQYEKVKVGGHIISGDIWTFSFFTGH